MKPGFIFLLIVSCFLQQCSGGNEKDNEATVGSALEDRARIIMLDGNVFLYAGATKNISFVADTGGGIYLGTVDVRSLPNKTQVETLNLLLGSNSEVMKNLHQSVSATERQVPQLRREITGIKMRQSIVMGMLRRMNDTRNRNRNNQRVRKTLATLTRQVDKLYKLVNQDDCLNAPCKNGGTCIDLMGGYKCLCPKHFVGKHCQEREDECQMYSGTHAGCQNNATCINNQNITGFTCNCTKGYHGPLCQYTQSSCNQAILLCGEHGHCVDRLNGGGQSSYDCICDWGYRKTVDPINPTCIDIDECANSPCFPGSNCLNLPGSFKCESCPPGYVGNGVTCHDFDECASKLSHGCSRNPETECINTVGGYKCGPCPSGYKGNGFRCEPLKYCDNNPCVATATCLEHEAACMCPAGYMGDGIKEGGTGCELIYYTCMSLTCSNGGSCRYVHPKPGETPVQRCYCPAGFHGPQCEYEDLCAQSDYCNGHGNCTKVGNTASCNCYPSYYDDRCQTTEAPGCSFHTYNETGSVEFHPEYDSSAAQYRAPACAWVINLRDTRKVVELWFDYFEQDSTNTSTCENRDSLIVFDTNTKPIDLIADLCTDEQARTLKLLPRNTTPIYSSSNSLNINYFFANSANKSRVKMNWRAVEPICGGRLIDQTGTFEYTSSRAFEHCSWYISVKAGYYLEVTVESMVMASTDLRNCSINQIEIFDDSFIGNDPARVAQLCQTDSTPTIRRLSGRNAVVHLSYNSYNASDEYLDNCRMRTTSANNTDQNPKCKVYLRVSYKSIQLPDNCGGEIKLLDFNSMEDSTGYIESPNYGHAYFPNLNCLWSLDASDAFNNSLFQDLGMIRLEFVDLDVDSDGSNKDIFGDPSCPGDYIKLSTMPDERFCNAHRPKIVFAREKMEIEFVTNGQSKYKSRGTGFRIKYQTMCYQELKAANGTIQSPNYRFPSPVPFKCHYHIASSPQATVKINFDYIGLRPFSMACIHPRFANNITDDYVEFAGGHSSNIQINRRYYCSRYPFSAPNGEFVASGNKGLSFVYSTSGDKENTGFLFHYEIEHIGCGGYSIGMSGRIQSPNYPEIYPPNLYCIYTILLFKPKDLSIYQTHGVRLTFDTFNVENIASRDDCGFDAVRVYEHYRDENNTGKLLGRFCGVRTPPPILTTHSTMAIVFLSDRSVSGTGFSAHWEAVNLAKDCNRVFNEPSGLITFDSDDFEDVTTCDYIIVLPTMNRIELTIENMTLPCDEGRIMFRNGGDESSPEFPDLYGDSQMCNGKVVSRLQSQGNQVFMRLTIVNTERASFKIRYEQLASGCGGYMSGFAGALSAPQYPHSDSRFINCEWQIAVALGNYVQLRFIKIDNLDSADRSGLCAPFARNFIEVTTSSSPDAHVLKRYCRSEASPDAISSDTNQMFVRYGQNGGSINGGLYGFLAQYTSICENVELNNTHGSIQSPGYPFRISEARDCSWTIDTTPGSYIKVVFHKFNIKDTSYLRIGNRQIECMSNYLEIDPTQINRTTGMTDSKPSNDLKIYKFCDRAAEPTIIYSKSNTLELKFKSTADRPENHFWLSWSTIGCGAHILQNGTTISALDSHFVNVSISPQRECLWVAKAPIGYVVQVDINHLFTTGSVQENDASVCVPSKFSGLEFFYGTQPSNYVQKEMCGAISKQKYISFSNELTIRLRFDGRNQNSQNGSIFRASVTFVQPALNKSCGGVIKVRPGVNETLHSPNYPKAYPRAVECVWQFETQKGYTISYNLSRYDTPNQHAKRTVGTLTRPSQNTRCSYGLGYIEGNVAFYASAYNRSKFEVNIDYYKTVYMFPRAAAIQRICVDIAEPIIVQTLVNVSAVTFNGAPYEASVPSGDIKVTTPIGFQLEAFAVCGGTLYASSTRQVFKLGGLFMEKQSKECELLIERDETASSYQSDLSAPIYARFELQANNMKVQNETDITINVRCGSTENKIVITHTDDIDHAEEIRQIKCDTALTVTVPPFDAGKSLVITYDTEMKFCGAQFGAIKGIVNMGDLKEDIECEWLFSLFDGNSVEIQIGPSYLNPSPYCAQSYIELRADNKSGPLLGRHCGKISPFKLKAGKVYMRLRQVLDKPEDDDYVPEYETSDEEPGEKPHFLFSYKYHLGGYTQSKKIVMFWRSTDYIDLTNPNNARISWMLSAKNPDNYIRVHISSKFDVDIVILDYHCPTPCLDPYYPNGVRQIDEERADVHNKVYLIKSNIATILATEIVSSSAFEIDWDEVPAREVNKTLALEETTRESDFTCGGELTATYQPQKLVLPTNVYDEYELDMRCRWKLRRPMFSGITFTIKRLDLEDHEECLYDYLTITSKEYTSLEELAQSPFTKFCHKSHVGYELTLNYDEYVYMYFVSDSSSSYSGFTIEYRLGCRTFEYIPSSIGLFDVILESPSYPDTSSYNYSCMWGLMLESNRDVEVVSLDMDMMPRVDGACKEDSLKIGDFPSPLDPTRRTGEFCGKENVSFIAPSGRVYVQLEKPINTAVHRGFRLRIHEVVHSCSSETLFVDEHTKSAVLTSPNFPHLAPNSLDCRWVLSVPAGHRLKFTVDPNNFNLQNAHDVECKDDYMEIYDGASEGAPFLGRQVYCNKNPPSTIISSDSHLFVRFTTDYFAQSYGWNATYELASCGGTVILQTNQNKSITSTHFPDAYPLKETCEWTVRPPPGHFVHAKFNHLWLYVMDNCTRDYLTLRENNSTGKVIMPQTCTYRNVNQTGYYLNGNAYLKFQSNNTVSRLTRTNCLSGKCGFDLDFSASRFECGGLITDEEGEVYLQTTSENKIIKGLRCQYDMRAGIGYRYRIEFFFVEENPDNHGYYYKTNMYGESPLNWCFPDLEIWNGPYDSRYNLFGIHMRFCQNRTTFVSSSDIVSVVYEDRSDVYNFYFSLNETRLHRPFGFKYTKVEADYDENVCMYHVTENTNITVQNMTYYTRSSQLINGAVLGQAKSFCHIRVDNPLRSATVSLNFTNFKGGRLGMNMCGIMDNKVVISDTETHIWPIRETLCSAVVKNSSAFFVYNHPLVDVFVQNNPFSYLYGYDTTIRFNLSVVFHACGGYITEDENGNAGTITSPGFNRGNYSNSVDCMWTFQAPEGKVVQLNFTYMDIEYSHECNKKDFLEVTAGEDRHSVISSYCYTKDGPEDQRLPDRYRVVKTFGRYLTMYFHSDESETRRGFSVNWEFTHFDNGTCGFTTHAQTGIIHSPNYPDDYPNNLKCMWHIVVPPGFHIKLTFDHVDIQESHQCTKDYLSISQEHQSRGQDPLNAYYFYYDHEEMLNNSCGIINLPQIDTESNQVRVNFTTDKKITGKGFKLRWKAECGTVFKTSHGVVMSPFYPRYYPNENFECNYLINPETDYEKIITVRLVDADLDTTLTSMIGDCSSDYVEIFDVAQSASLVKFCGRDQLTLSEATSVFSVRGSVGVKFVSNMSLMHDVKKKNHRGFKITYALSECGGDIELAEAHNRLAGTINSPGYPMPYFEDMDCVWNVTAPEGYIISVKFTGIDIEGTTNCTYDYVEVFDGPEMQNETSFGRLCGPRPPQGQRISKSNKMVIRFVSDSTANRAGFMAVVTATIGPKRGCGGELYASSDIKSISVPLADNGDSYMNNLRCTWKLTTNTTKIIEVNLTMFDLEKRYRENNVSECFDFLAIYDGPSSISPFLFKPTCELPKDMQKNLPITFHSSFHTLEAYFESDHSDAYGGFELKYRSIEHDCGGIWMSYATPSELSYESWKTTTRTHQKRKRCRFFIKSVKNEPIELNFQQFSFPSKTPDCVDEYLEIRDVGMIAECQHPSCATTQSEVGNGIRICGGNTPSRFVSKTSLVQIVASVVLQSQYSASFSLRHNILDSCNRTISIKTGVERWASGQISSPNYPKAYDDNATCITKVEAPKDYQIFLTFHLFSMERGTRRVIAPNGTVVQRYGYGLGYRAVVTCEFDNLTIYYNETTPTQNETYCGWSGPPSQLTPNNTLFLKLITDGTNGMVGYNAYYYAVKVVEDRPYHKFYNFAPIYEPSGYLSNLGYPGYPQNTTQRWTVIPPSGMSCTVKILTSMSKVRSCSTNEKVKWAHYIGSMPEQWIDLPCYNPYPRDAYNLTAGERMMFEITTDKYAYNNGIGLRVFWNCINAGTPVFTVDEWESETY